MQANLPKKFHRARGQAVTVEKQAFMKFNESFAELDHCTDRSVQAQLRDFTCLLVLLQPGSVAPEKLFPKLYGIIILITYDRKSYARTIGGAVDEIHIL